MRIYKRKGKKGTVWFLDYQENGQRIRKRAEGVTTEKGAKIYLARLLEDKERGLLSLPKRTAQEITLEEALLAFVAQRETEERRIVLRAWAGKMIGIMGNPSIKDIAESEILKYRDFLMETDAPGTINAKLGMLKTSLRPYVESGILARNPAQNIKKVSDSRPPCWKWLKRDEVSRLLSALEHGGKCFTKPSNRQGYFYRLKGNQYLFRLVVFLLNTGCRLGEALALTWDKIDMERKVVQISTTKHASNGRTAKQRYIPLNDTLLSMLETMKQEGGKRVFRENQNINRQFDSYLKAAGIEHCRIHDLRHTAASHLTQQGTPLAVVREILGHSTLTMTLKYSHLAPDEGRKYFENLSFASQL